MTDHRVLASLPDSLDAHWLRACFLHNAPESQPVSETGVPPSLIPAAVLVPVINRSNGLAVLLTRRTDHLHHHPGQISFPGGRVESSDASPVMTALRETEEEIGLAPDRVELLGELPEHRTGTGFRITPVVGLVHPPVQLKLDDFEVAEAFEVPLAFLLAPSNRRRHEIEHEGHLRQYYAIPYQDFFIWGATAGILVSLGNFLLRARMTL